MKTLNALLLLVVIACFAGCEKETVKVIPTIYFTGVTNITATSVTCTGEVTSDGGSEVTSRGVCWSTSPSPTIANDKTTDGTGIGIFASSLTDLTPNTDYFVVAYATNSIGTAYHVWGWIRTDNLHYSTVTDIDNNIYKTIKIGTQTWMAENLKVTKYRNGDPISNVTNNTTWGSLTTGAYCNYNNEVNNSTTYGSLYNWFAVADKRNIAPTGWHVASDTEWTTLTTYLNGEGVAGGKLKEAGTTHWLNPNTGATNETGFTALSGGCRYREASGYFGYNGFWWSSTEFGASHGWYRKMNNNNSNVDKYYEFKYIGFSVRCVKD
jgi:uncharacterized protein (TIGR02145 family)